MSVEPAIERADHLALGEVVAVQKLLQKEGPGESIIFSDLVTKINRKDKEQTRILLVTDKGLYNLIPNNYKLKRRISIASLLALSMSSSSEEFVVHVQDEYDYRYKSAQKQAIASALLRLHSDLSGGKKLTIKLLDAPDLKCMALTRVMARQQTREAELRRRLELSAGDDLEDSDQEDQHKITKSAGGHHGGPSDDGDDSGDELDGLGHSRPEGEEDDRITEMPGVGVGPKNGDAKVRIEDFELLRVVGRGSFGKVMQVRHRATGEIYAMKILKKGAIAARNQVEHTKAERQILEALQHPFLMTLRFAFQSKDKLYFVLDYYTGGELFFHLKNVRKFTEEVARIYIAEIALALGHLHALGYVYRDLKPENILLDNQGHVCLTDFGLSKDMEVGAKAHTFCGTPEYLAPEIVAGVGHDKAIDWWALGILLYELTVGIPPFYDANPNEMYVKIQRGVLRFPHYLSEHCKSIIVAMLNRTPEKRLGSLNDVDDLKQHPFYEGFDWDRLMRKEMDVPYKPRVLGKDDASNYDPTFTSEPVVDSVVPTSALAAATGPEESFEGFTYDSRRAEPGFLGK
jgi:hypothetical protein